MRRLSLLSLMLPFLCLALPAEAYVGRATTLIAPGALSVGDPLFMLTAETMAALQAKGAPALGGPVASAMPAELPVDPEGAQLAQIILDAIMSGNLAAIIAAGVLVLLVFLLRRYVGRLVPWLPSKAAGVLVTLLVSIGGALVTAFVAGAPLTSTLIQQALLVGLAAIGLFSGPKNLGEAVGLIPSKPPTVATVQEAHAVLQRAGMGPHP